MKKLFKLFILTFFVLLKYSTSSAQTTYIWDGSSSTDWNTAANWTPATVPTSSDHVVLANVTNDPVLDANRTVNNLTLSAGTVLDLGGYTLTVSGAAALNAGTVTNGTFYMNSGSADLAGVDMDCKVDVSANIVKVYDSWFADSTLLNETHSTGYYMRGSRFEEYAEISNSSTGYIYTGNNSPDTFMAPAVFNLEAAGYIVFGHNAVGAYFADEVTVNNHSGNTSRGFLFGGNSNSTARFEGDIIMNVSSGSGYINFYLGTNTHVGSLLIGTEGISAGAITLTKYTQTSAVPVDLSGMTGTSLLVLGTGLRLKGELTGPNVSTTISGGCVFESTVNLPKVYGWNGSRFEGVTDLVVANPTWVFTGSNVFLDTTTITRTVSNDLYTGNNSPDTFMAPVTFNLEVAGYIYMGRNSVGNYYADEVTMNNHSGHTGRGFYIGGASNATNHFADDIILNVDSTSGPIHFCIGTITHAGLLRIGTEGYHSGLLTLDRYTQTASGSIDLRPMDHNSSLSILSYADIEADVQYDGPGTATLTSATFHGNVDIESPSLPVTGCDFHGITRLEKTGTVNNLNGGNIFHGATTLENSSTANYVYWGNSVADTFMTDLTLINHSSQPLWMNYTSTGHYAGDITLQGTSGKIIRFGNTTTGRKAVFNGSTDQDLTIATTGLDVQLYRAQINKSGGRLKLNSNVKVDYELALTDGIIEMNPSSTSGYGAILSLADGVAPSASDSSYIEGAVKKIGNDAFTFPVGRNGHYRPIGISAPGNVADAFTAEYLNEDPDGLYDTSLMDTTINEVESNEYWVLNRPTGTSNVTVTLSWDDMSCGFDTLTDLRVTAWNGTKWKDLGIGTTTGNDASGTIATASAATIYGAYTVATVDTFDCVPCRADAGEDVVSWPSLGVLIGSQAIAGVDYEWNPQTNLDDHEIATPDASPALTTVYKVSASNTEGCIASDEVQVEIIPRPGMPPCLHGNH